VAFVGKVEPADAKGPLAAIYRAAIERAGKVFQILQVQSLEPRTLQASMGLYLATTTDPRSPLPRWFRELLAVRVSRLNHCVY
jgi:alkylhydroperoxidase family enzyme